MTTWRAKSARTSRFPRSETLDLSLNPDATPVALMRRLLGVS